MKSRGKKRRKAIAFVVALRIFLGGPQLASANPGASNSGGPSQTKISRVVDPPSKFTAGSKAKGAARRDFARGQTGSRRSRGSLFADAFTVEPKFPARPGRNGPTADPGNSGCAGGPRSLTVLSSHDNPSSSAEQNTIEDLGKKWEKLSAEEKYDSIRKSKTDVDAIAKNIGYKRKNVQNCKNHLFYDNHRLDRYESLGESVEIKRFDANENQARTWKRLEKGTHTRQDLTWLKHEKAEQWYEQKHDAGYSESHEAAEKHWSGTPWTNTNTNTEDKE